MRRDHLPFRRGWTELIRYPRHRAQESLRQTSRHSKRRLEARGIVYKTLGTWDKINPKSLSWLTANGYEFVKNAGVGAAFIAGISGLVALAQKFAKWRASKAGADAQPTNSTLVDDSLLTTSNGMTNTTVATDEQTTSNNRLAR